MNRKLLSRLLCPLLLLIILLWRMIGAPLTQADWENVQTALWQAGSLLPSRMARMTVLWPLSGAAEAKGAATGLTWEEEDDPEEALVNQLVQQKRESMTLAVFDTKTDTLLSIPLESYVCSVVAAEMPASYHLEALKAQAVAARTRALDQSAAYGSAGCSLHSEADICTDSAHCQGFASAEDCQAKWGDEYSIYRARVEQAVSSTFGEIITYEGEPITVFYHAISGGMTEDAQTVFSQSLPYLTSVTSIGEETARGYSTDATFTFQEAAGMLQKAFPDVDITAEDVRQNLQIRSYTPTGRVDILSIGEKEIKASQVRSALGLRSTWFTLSTDHNSITFHQRGYGHGVGMSQAGANAMAAESANYQEILAHYFLGTIVESLKP